MRGPRSLVLLFVFALPACSLVFDLPGTGGSVQAEGGPGPDGVAVDAAAEASPVADGGSFCLPGAHAFCADFDEGTLTDGWKASNVLSPGTLALATDRSVSSPRSLYATMPRRGGGAAYAKATLVGQIDGSWRRTVVELDAYLDPITWQAGDVNSGAFFFSFFGAASSWNLTVSLGETYTGVNIPGQDLSGGAIPTGVWTHWRFDVAPSGSVDVTLGPVHITGAASGPTGAAEGIRFELGIDGYNQPAPAYGVHYDNLTVDFP